MTEKGTQERVWCALRRSRHPSSREAASASSRHPITGRLTLSRPRTRSPGTNRPGVPMAVPLPQISSRAWEHPADRTALDTLRAIPGFDEVVRKVAGFITERGVRQLFLANAVQAGPAQRSKLHALLGDVCATLDWPDRPDLYVTQSPTVNAYAIGFERLFIVITSGALELL